MIKILITGSNGQVGAELIRIIKSSIDAEILCTDITPRNQSIGDLQFEYLDVKSKELTEKIFEKFKPDQVYHLASILSASGEKDPYLAYSVNLTGTMNILNASVKYNVNKVFIPSTIGVYGPEAPKENAPIRHDSIPTTMYGITKAAGEMLFQYYYEKFDLDVRSLRYPGLISYRVPPTAGTTDYAVDMIRHAARNSSYLCYLEKDTPLPMMYMQDAMESTIKFMHTEPSRLTVRTAYNVMSYTFTPEQLYKEILEFKPNFKVDYKPDFRQKIAESWPHSLDITKSKSDWDFAIRYDLKKTVQDMIENLQ
ncbi:NAD-dependent epimerase/dehydratase family protein [Cuniculiplasma sp. SKW3]|uniref:NAD-dependent epimerase/dehydratase family protein n=1 Tax=unclassified Cuniculiplasma TaxID=2619706 RepID=UPI003FD1D393